MTDYAQKQLEWAEALELERWLAPLPPIPLDQLPQREKFADTSEDQGVGNHFGTDGSTIPDLGPLASFGSWASVVATIDRKAQQLSNFNPSDTNFDSQEWADYAYKFSTIPFWLGTAADSREAQVSSLDLTKGVDAVIDLVVSIATPGVVDNIITSIRKIGELAMQNKGATQKQNSQQQGVISIKSSALYASYIRTSVEMVYKSGKGYEQLTQKLSVSRFYGILDFDKCKRSANTILAWDGQDVDEWEKKTSSAPFPPNDSPAWGQYNKSK
ncbi:MAG: hypothetical protein RMY62_007740 [Nostoc sp. ZfuVER08]|jgi:hypothetical protein|uniref:Uncharacterized protein n=1 Tax=Nostoc punctiforme FACHB-252 TaxID=1357509 RepID=A0ABR8HIA9_NOSPU|nr:hypothetical protein [Nostoc punctiforme]MBD2615534.1 hypothetical protein [Nostoc punctiforme FACHB-252]MBL1202530.1 hypothetical protein [Nostoc sp. GBBB01]MDZ8013623.1 hypothetical protein [Nostoc sp. ZfuVER08]